MRVLNDLRTVVVGCSDGVLLSYVVFDLAVDSDATVETVIGSLSTRQTAACGQRTPVAVRAWDKVDRVAGTAPVYSRPPSSIVPVGPTDKLALRQLGVDEAVSGRQRQPPSSSQLYRLNSCRSQACLVM